MNNVLIDKEKVHKMELKKVKFEIIHFKRKINYNNKF